MPPAGPLIDFCSVSCSDRWHALRVQGTGHGATDLGRRLGLHDIDAARWSCPSAEPPPWAGAIASSPAGPIRAC